MGLGLSNARLSVAGGGSAPPVQQVNPARTSIAEDAVFIPKPHKRVDFKVNAPGGGSPETVQQTQGAGSGKPIPLPGQAGDNGGGKLKPLGSGAGAPPERPGAPRDTVSVSGQNISTGQLGEHGLTAEFGKDAYIAPQALVSVEYNNTPQKDNSVIVTQEEGRQTNHAKQVHYTQQYDAYGRPRIGFSREPYDFAAIKFMVKTAQIHFQQNMQNTRGQYDKYSGDAEAPASEQAAAGTGSATGGPAAPAQETAAVTGPETPNAKKGMIDPEQSKGVKGMIDPKENANNMIGAAKQPDPGMLTYDPTRVNVPGGKQNQKDPAAQNANGAFSSAFDSVMMKGESALEVARKMGMKVDAVMTPAEVAKAAAKLGMNISSAAKTAADALAAVHGTDRLMRSGAALSVSA